MLFIVFGILLIVLAYGTIIYFRDKEKFDRQKSLIEFWSIFITIIFAFVALNQTSTNIENSAKDFNNLITKLEEIIGDVQESKEVLNDVKLSLSELPTQIDSFASSINSLNNVVSSQKELLSNTLTGFNESIYAFKSSVDSMVKRFNRKPFLKVELGIVDADTISTIDKIVITNYGALSAEIKLIRLHLPTESILSFNWDNSSKDQEYEETTTYQANFTNTYVFPDSLKPFVSRCNITLTIKEGITIRVIVYYKSDFGNDGVVEQAYYSYYKSNKPAKSSRD